MKKVQGKKKRDAAVAEEEAKSKAAQVKESGLPVQTEGGVAGQGDQHVLGTEDEDVIF